jgi:F420H(2)-dependent biliverdin reductase
MAVSRRASGAADWDAFPQALLDFWAERHLCTLTTLRADGTPHVVPVGVALDLEQRCAWVITDAASAKARHLPGPVAAACVDGARWSTLEGTAVALGDAASVARAEERYAARYREPRPNPTRVAVRISLTRVLGSNQLFA